MLRGVFHAPSLSCKSTHFRITGWALGLVLKRKIESNTGYNLLRRRTFLLQSWITQSLSQPRRTLCSVVAMVPMDMCTWNSWVTLEPRLGSWSHREENYIAMKTRVASKLSLSLLLMLLLLLLCTCCWSRRHDWGENYERARVNLYCSAKYHKGFIGLLSANNYYNEVIFSVIL